MSRDLLDARILVERFPYGRFGFDRMLRDVAIGYVELTHAEVVECVLGGLGADRAQTVGTGRLDDLVNTT